MRVQYAEENGISTKQCTKCLRELSLDKYGNLYSKGRPYYKSACRECLAADKRKNNLKREPYAHKKRVKRAPLTAIVRLLEQEPELVKVVANALGPKFSLAYREELRLIDNYDLQRRKMLESRPQNNQWRWQSRGKAYGNNGNASDQKAG